jgi:hypothetical protein
MSLTREIPIAALGGLRTSENENIQDYKFTCGFVWVRNLVSDTKGVTEAEGV